MILLYKNYFNFPFVGCAKLIDLVNFWTAGKVVGFKNEILMVKFNDSTESRLLLAETCFMGIVLPTRYNNYEDFKHNKDIAISYGSKGFDFT